MFHAYVFDDVMIFQILKFYKNENLENEKGFWSEINNFFPSFKNALF